MIHRELKVPTEAVRDLCRKYRVSRLEIFGSALTNDFNAQSDVDLLVEFQPDARVGLIALSSLQRELAAVLGRPVDLVPKNGLKPAIRQEVLSSAEVLYAA